MYFHAGATVLAVNALTGAEIWKLEIDGVSGGPVRGPLHVNGRLYTYHGDKLAAVDAESGELVEAFGDGGVLPVFGLALAHKYPDSYPPGFDASTLNYRINSSPAYHDNTLYIASAISEGNIPGGLVVAADAATGAIKWVFNTIPPAPAGRGLGDRRVDLGRGQAGRGRRLDPAGHRRRARAALLQHRQPEPAVRRLGAARGRTCSPTPRWRSTWRPASCAGSTRPSTTTCGTGTT